MMTRSQTSVLQSANWEWSTLRNDHKFEPLSPSEVSLSFLLLSLPLVPTGVLVQFVATGNLVVGETLKTIALQPLSKPKPDSCFWSRDFLSASALSFRSSEEQPCLTASCLRWRRLCSSGNRSHRVLDSSSTLSRGSWGPQEARRCWGEGRPMPRRRSRCRRRRWAGVFIIVLYGFYFVVCCFCFVFFNTKHTFEASLLPHAQVLNLDCVDVFAMLLGQRMFAATTSHLASFACNFSTQDVCWVQKPLWWADLQAHSVTADLVQNKMCLSVRCLAFPLGLTYTLRPVFENGEARCLGVLAGVNHCCRSKFESHQPFVASDASVATMRTVLCSAVAAHLVFYPDRHFCGLLWTVSVHIAVSCSQQPPRFLQHCGFFTLAAFPIQCWMLKHLKKPGGFSERNNLNYFYWSIFKKNIYCPNSTTNHHLMDVSGEFKQRGANSINQLALIAQVLASCCGISW